jgi:hypothetical protein
MPASTPTANMAKLEIAAVARVFPFKSTGDGD